MKPYLRTILAAGLLLATFSFVRANSRTGSIVAEEATDSSENYGECKEPFVTQLEDDYSNAFIQMSEFFKSTHTAFAKLNERLDQLENRLEILQMDIMKIKKNIPNTPEELLQFLRPPANGHSFGGSTFEQIAAALPSHSMAVKFVNYMDTDLTGYQLNLHFGSAETNAPTTISSQTAQVATFKQHSYGDVVGTMMYRIGGSMSFLHVYFRVWENKYRTFAVAFLSKGAPDNTIGWNRCTHSGRPTEPIEKYRCEGNVPSDTAKSLLIHEGNVYVKATFTPKRTTSTLIIEVFKFTL